MTVCKGNLRQIGIGVLLYTDDHGSFPLFAHTPSNFKDPKLYIEHPEFTAFAQEYLGCAKPHWSLSTNPDNYGVLNCPGKRATKISWATINDVSYITGEIVASYYAEYQAPSGTVVLRQHSKINAELTKVFGPVADYYADPARFHKAGDASAIPVFCDEAIASGLAGSLATKPFNHGNVDNPRLNVLYADGSVNLQKGDWNFIGDKYGLRRIDSLTFPSYYLPYIRMAPFPVQ